MSAEPTDKTWEEVLAVTILNRLWRVDTAARAFPQGHQNEALMKARWTIGLYLEVVRGHSGYANSFPVTFKYSRNCATPWGMQSYVDS